LCSLLPLELIDDMEELAVEAEAGVVLCWPVADVSWANAGTANAAAINAGRINLRMGTVPREVRCWFRAALVSALQMIRASSPLPPEPPEAAATLTGGSPLAMLRG